MAIAMSLVMSLVQTIARLGFAPNLAGSGNGSLASPGAWWQQEQPVRDDLEGFLLGGQLSTVQLGQVLINRAHHDRSFSHRARDALDGPVAHVAHGEHAWQAGLERQWRAL